MASVSSEISESSEAYEPSKFMGTLYWTISDAWVLAKVIFRSICKWIFTVAFVTFWIYCDPATEILNSLEINMISTKFLTGVAGMLISNLHVRTSERFLTRPMAAIIVLEKLPYDHPYAYEFFGNLCKASHLPLNYTTNEFKNCTETRRYCKTKNCSPEGHRKPQRHTLSCGRLEQDLAVHCASTIDVVDVECKH